MLGALDAYKSSCRLLHGLPKAVDIHCRLHVDAAVYNACVVLSPPASLCSACCAVVLLDSHQQLAKQP